jgi:uncharacterized protein (TIGR00369 family)
MAAEFKFADETEVKVSQLMTPEWANFLGNVHGGSVISLVDNISYVCAARFCGTVCVTASEDRVDFYEPIHVGELLNLTARITYVGRTSMEVETVVHAEEIPTGKVRHTNTCHLTMVSMVDGKPNPVPHAPRDGPEVPRRARPIRPTVRGHDRRSARRAYADGGTVIAVLE